MASVGEVEEDTTVRGRELGEGLRNALEAAGLQGREVARKLGWSPSKVSRLLNGKRGTTEWTLRQCWR